MQAPGRGRAPAGRPLTPLWILSLFLTLTESVLGVAVTQTAGGVQLVLTIFVVVFPTVIAGGFFAILWSRPWVFYSPSEYNGADVGRYVDALTQARFAHTTTRTADVSGEITVVGNPDQFRLLFKASSGWWQKSTKAMAVSGGVIVQVSSEFLNPDGSVSVAEALAFVPGVTIEDDPQGQGRHLRPREPST